MDSMRFEKYLKNMIFAAFKPDEYYADDIEQVYPSYIPKN